MNEELIAKLRDLLLLSQYNGNKWSSERYSYVISVLSRSPDVFNMSMSERDQFLHSVCGDEAINEYIHEYIYFGTISRLVDNKKIIDAYKALSKVYSIGPAKCKELINKGIYTIDSLRSSDVNLTHAQRYGLLYYEDLNTRIPRDEITTIGGTIHDILKSFDDNILFDITGSYRRMAAHSGDIDILISSDIPDILSRFMDVIEESTEYIVTLNAGPSRVTILYKKYNIVRQVDILVVSLKSYYTALVYFTGSAEFNIAMRGHAKRNGYRLNQTGLYKNGRAIDVNSEKHLFDILNIKYIEPKYRNASYILS